MLILDRLRDMCLRRSENVVLEGTLVWAPAARMLLDELARRPYREASIVNVEVARGSRPNRPSPAGGPADAIRPMNWAGDGCHWP